MKKLPLLVVPVLALLALTGCSASAGHSSPDALLTAFADAGGNCDNPRESDLADNLDGVAGVRIQCDQDHTQLWLFDDAGQIDEATDILEGGWGIGSNWVISGSEEAVAAMGGVPSSCSRGKGCTPRED